MKRLAVPVLLAAFLLSGFIGAGLTQADFSSPTLLAFVTATPTAEQQLPNIDMTVFAHLDNGTGAGWLVGTGQSQLDRLAAADFTYQVLEQLVELNDSESYYVAYTMPGTEEVDWAGQAVTLLIAPGWRLIRTTPAQTAFLAEAGVELQRITLDPKPLAPQGSALPIPSDVVFDPVVQEMMDQVLSETVYSYTGGLSGEWPVDVGGEPFTISTRNTYSGEPIEKATQFVGAHFADLGLDIEYHQWAGSSYPNVIGEITGHANPENIYIFSAHLDDMPPSGPAPGADDNASGTVAALIAADIFSQYEWDCTLRFGLWTGEEQGLLGSKAYAQRADSQGEDIAGVINLDMIAWNTPSTSRTIDLHARSTLPGTIELAQLFADVIDVYSLDLTPEIVPNGTGASDASFWQFGYTAILGIEDFADFNPYYHTANDRLANLDLDYFTDFVKASIGSFVHMSDCLIPACTPVQVLDVATSADGCVVDFDPDYSGSTPISWNWAFEHGDPPISIFESPANIDFGISGTYAYTVSAANCGGTGLTTFADTVTVACDTCTPLSGVELTQVTTDPIYPGENITFSAHIIPGNASAPYSYTVAVDSIPILNGQSSADPLVFQHAFAGAGVYDVTVSVWNCDMAEPVTDTVSVTVEADTCTQLSEVSLTQESAGDVHVGDPVTFGTAIAPAGATRPYSYTFAVDGVVITDGQSSADALEFQHQFAVPGVHTVTFSAWNCGMAEPVADSLTVLVEAAACTQLTGASLTKETAGEVPIGEVVLFSAAIAPTDATRPYSYTFAVDGAVIAGGQSNADVLEFQHQFADPGVHTVTFSAWNCDMVEPVTDSLAVTVVTPVFVSYYPVIKRP